MLSDLFSNFWIALLAKLLFVALFIPLIGIGWAQPIADGIKFIRGSGLASVEHPSRDPSGRTRR